MSLKGYTLSQESLTGETFRFVAEAPQGEAGLPRAFALKYFCLARAFS
jgi:hypothetical protein